VESYNNIHTYNTAFGLIIIEIILLNHLTISQARWMSGAGVVTTGLCDYQGVVPHDTHDQCSLIHNINKLNNKYTTGFVLFKSR
jgi:hypothetical protein